MKAARAAFFLALLLLVPFRDVVLRGHVLFERDIQLYRWSLLQAFALCLRAPSPPLWTPLAGFGQPLLGNPGAQVLYPWTWLSLFLPPWDAYDAYAIGHVFLGGLGTLVLARRLGLSLRSAFLSGALFLLSGPFLSVVNLWQHLAGAALLPWVLLAADAALGAPGPARALVWGGAVAVQLLTGSLDFVILGALAQGVLALRHLRWGTRGEAALRQLATAAGAAGFAVLVTAAQWMPALEFLRTTWRSRTSESIRLMFSVHPQHLLQTLVPLFPFDLPLAPATRALLADNLEGRDPLLGSLYLGAAGLPLVISALCSPRRRDAAALVGLALLALALALGRHGIAYFWAVEALPVLDLFRFPAKAMVLVALAWSLLAGLGLDAWPHLSRGAATLGSVLTVLVALGLITLGQFGAGWAPPFLSPDMVGGLPLPRLLPMLASVRDAGVLAAAAAGVCLAAGLRPRPGPGLPRAALLLAVGDLALAHLHLVPQAPREWFAPTPAVIEAAKADGARRLYLFDYRRRRAGRPAGPWKPDETEAFLALSRAEQVAGLGQEYPPDGTRWALPGGFETDVAGLESPAHLSLNLLVRFHQEDEEPFARLLRIGGMTHLATRHRLPYGVFALHIAFETPHLGEVFLYHVPQALPRAYVVEGVRAAAGRAAYAALLDPGFDPEREVVLATGESRPPSPDFRGEARVTSDRPGQVVVEASLNRPGHLVVLEGEGAGWRARVDGLAAPLIAGNAIFLAVPLEAGEHRIELAYLPRSVFVGLALSGAALAAVVFALRAGRARSYSSTEM